MILGAEEFLKTTTPLKRGLLGVFCGLILPILGFVLFYGMSSSEPRPMPRSDEEWFEWLWVSVFYEFIAAGAVYTTLLLTWCVWRPKPVASFLLWSAHSVWKLFFVMCFVIAAFMAFLMVRESLRNP